MKQKISFIVLFILISCYSLAQSFSRERIVLCGGETIGGDKVLKQEMFYKEDNGSIVPYTNTIFVIESNFEVTDDVTIPNGCELEFKGGCLKNGRINTNGCYINAGPFQVFDNIKFNTINRYDGELEEVDNIYIKVLAGGSFVNKKTNTLIAANSIVNRRYTYKIKCKSTSPKTEGQSVTVTLNGQKYTIAGITSDGRYKLCYDYSRIIGVDNSTGKMVTGIVKSLKGVTFYSIAPLSYDNNSTVKNKVIHPEWFGAKGDNKNEDSYAFNTALDLAYHSDSKVVIGNGVYKIDDALVVHTHTYLEGVVPTVENPVNGFFSVNTDVAMLVFDKYNPTGSYVLDNIGFRPHSKIYNGNYIGIKIYHSQNYARISNIGFYLPKIGIDIDALGGVQLLRCEDISLRGEENREIVAFSSKYDLDGWSSGNYFRPAFISNSTVIKCDGKGKNTIEGGTCETNSYSDYLIELNNGATLIVKGGLYRETGKIAKVQNSSRLIFEGDNYLIGKIDCDVTSYIISPLRNVQTRQQIINNSVVYNDVVLAHYKIFSKNCRLWHETINNKIVKPQELSDNYETIRYNNRIYSMGACTIPVDDIDINGKTIVLRVISPKAYSSAHRSHPFIINAGIKDYAIDYSQGRSIDLDNTSILYAPGEVNLGAIEKGERYFFLPSPKEKYLMKNITTDGNPSFMISDIYIIDKDYNDFVGNEELRIIDIMNGLDMNVYEDGYLNGYNKGTSKDRPTDLTSEEEGFEFFDTTLHKPVYWSGDKSIGDNGWVDAMGGHPIR